MPPAFLLGFRFPLGILSIRQPCRLTGDFPSDYISPARTRSSINLNSPVSFLPFSGCLGARCRGCIAHRAPSGCTRRCERRTSPGRGTPLRGATTARRGRRSPLVEVAPFPVARLRPALPHSDGLESDTEPARIRHRARSNPTSKATWAAFARRRSRYSMLVVIHRTRETPLERTWLFDQ